MRKSSLALTLLATVVGLWGCQGTRGGASASALALDEPRTDADGVSRLHEKDLEHLGLEVVWTQKLHARPQESLIDAYLLGDLIIMETSGRRLYGIDRRTGAPIWMVELPNRADFRGCQDEDHIYVSCRNVLIAIDKRGFVTWRKFLKFAPGGSPVADDAHVYLPCIDGALRSFLKDKGYFDRQNTSDGEMEARPALGSRLVYAGSTDGTLYALTTDMLDRSWTYKTFGAIRADVVFDTRRVYVTSADGSLYSLVDMPQATREQQLAWNRPYASGASIEKPPYVVKSMVLVVNSRGECHAVDRAHGRALWVVPNVDKVLTQGRLNTYLLREHSRIVAADNKTGVVRWQLDTQPGAFLFFPDNTMDDVIYLVKQNGETQAIRERKLVKPAPAPAPAAAPADAAP